MQKATALPKYLQKYLVPEIINSAFNKMPDAGDNSCFLLLEQNYFLALSWMIAELGKLKDNGLRLIAIKEALQQAGSVSDDEALNKAKGFIGGEQLTLDEVLVAANKLSKTYFAENNLVRLIKGTASANA
jgi:hypothetical protein